MCGLPDGWSWDFGVATGSKPTSSALLAVGPRSPNGPSPVVLLGLQLTTCSSWSSQPLIA